MQEVVRDGKNGLELAIGCTTVNILTKLHRDEISKV